MSKMFNSIVVAIVDIDNTKIPSPANSRMLKLFAIVAMAYAGNTEIYSGGTGKH